MIDQKAPNPGLRLPREPALRPPGTSAPERGSVSVPLAPEISETWEGRKDLFILIPEICLCGVFPRLLHGVQDYMCFWRAGMVASTQQGGDKNQS